MINNHKFSMVPSKALTVMRQFWQGKLGSNIGSTSGFAQSLAKLVAHRLSCCFGVQCPNFDFAEGLARVVALNRIPLSKP